MASGSFSGRANNQGSRPGLDFPSNDVLSSSYDAYDNSRESFHGGRSDPAIGASSNKDFHPTRVSRSPAFPNPNVYAQPEDSLNLELMTTVKRTMKRHEDNLMRFLEGINSRLSQLELYCYNLDKSIGKMQSDLAQHNGEADSKLNSMDKLLQEVHRSIQLLKDRQELFETQKELAKLQLAQKESSSHSQEANKSSMPSTAMQNTENGPEIYNEQFPLTLPPAPPLRTTENYLSATQFPNPANQSPPQPPQSSYTPAGSQYQAVEMAPNLFPGLFNQSQQVPQLHEYQTAPQALVHGTHTEASPSQSSLYNPRYMQSQLRNPLYMQEKMTSAKPMPHMTYDNEELHSRQPPQAHFSQGGYSPVNDHNYAHLYNPRIQQQPISVGVMHQGPNLGPPQNVRNRQPMPMI